MTAETGAAAGLRSLIEDQLKLSRALKARVRELEAERSAPLAVVGMGMRLPAGIDSPQAYWNFLRGDGTGYTGIPEDRPGLLAAHDPVVGKPGRSYVDKAGFVDDIASFDADFFGITDREARMLDPQQRLLLEAAWEALERAGLGVRRADRLDVGVYLGIMASEYNERFADRADPTRIDPYYTTGGGLCFPAGRISYVMGFRGPVVSVDTACSSSLTALHLAVGGLRAGECRYALVCGSNLLLSANLMVSLSATRALSPGGTSKSFLDTADGYGRGEGVGVLVLMRLADAELERRPILAVVRGTASNHDGAAASLTAPNGSAQQEVVRAALADAGTDPVEIGWIEAHGTGTALGDPVEVGALDGVLGAAVRARGVPLALGSVKSRIGHLEAASGIAALMKTVLMLRHGEIPAAARPDDGPLNTRIRWDELGLRVPRANEPWPQGLGGRVAGVNSFGMSGTNVHAVLAAYEPAVSQPAHPGRRELLTISARHPDSLAALVESVAGRLRKTEDTELAALCHTLNVGRSPLPLRIAVTGATGEELADALETAAHRAPIAPLHAVSLLVDPEDPAVGAAVAALHAAWPALADTAAGPDRALAEAVSRFGVRVRLAADPGARGAALTADGVTRPLPLTGEAPVPLLVDALAELFLAGADLRLAPLAAPGTPFVGDLPTYPFHRKRFWAPEPEQAVGQAVIAGASLPRPPAHDVAALRAHLLDELRDVLESTQPLDEAGSLLDAGGDSFLSTLFMTRVEEHYPVTLTPEDLPIDLPLAELVGRLAEHIAGNAA